MPLNTPAEAAIAAYTVELRHYEAGEAEHRRYVTDMRAAGHHALADCAEDIRANLVPVDPVTAAVARARRSFRAAWKVRAGLVPTLQGDAAAHWYGRNKAHAAAQMKLARDIRFELVVMPIEAAPVVNLRDAVRERAA